MRSAVLGEAISAMRDWSVSQVTEPRGPHASETFGSLVFNDQVQKQRLREEWDQFVDQLREPARKRATVQLYRSFLLRELPAIGRGRYRDRRLTVPTLFLLGEGDPVIQPEMIEPALPHADDMTLEAVSGTGHFIADEMPELVAERALEFLA